MSVVRVKASFLCLWFLACSCLVTHVTQRYLGHLAGFYLVLPPPPPRAQISHPSICLLES